ncbi:MAG: oxidoreductase [Rhodobacteraceae bacterium]|nr:oxidoreductase [Paracoccaceae bacterium]
MCKYRVPAAVTAALFLWVGTASASDLPMPEGEVVLTVSGNIATANDGDRALFDLSMLQGMGATRISTSTIWTDGVQSFTGVPLYILLEELGVTGGTLRATAINDYTVEIPVTDVGETFPIIAYLRNSEVMSIRDKGPLWIVYPYDLSPEYRTETSYAQSIWQLDRIEVVE